MLATRRLHKLKKILTFLKARYAPRGARQTFSQYAEDIIIRDLLKKQGIENPFYIDIGAHQPVFGNNTYLFYKNGARGVLVEPNPAMCELIEKKRPRDICLNAGAGRNDGEADFFSFTQSTRSTFSEAQALEWQKTSGQKPSLEKRRIVSLDTIIKDFCAGKTPDLVSIDAEGLDEEILRGYNWSVRPKIFCIESSGAVNKFMEDHGYVLKAQILHNAIFAEKSLKNI